MRTRLGLFAVVILLGCTGTVAADSGCPTSSCRADTGTYGSTFPDWVKPGATSLIYLYAKDNGPASTYGVTLHATVPYQLHIEYARAYPGKCTVKGTFVACYFGNFRREQVANAVIKVKTTKKGTYEIPAHVYTEGVDDPNGGNNQITATLAVYP